MSDSEMREKIEPYVWQGGLSDRQNKKNVDDLMSLFTEEMDKTDEYIFKFDTYFRDSTGHSAVTQPHAPIDVIASNKEQALKKVFAAFEGAEYKYKWSLRARLLSVSPLPIKEKIIEKKTGRLRFDNDGPTPKEPKEKK